MTNAHRLTCIVTYKMSFMAHKSQKYHQISLYANEEYDIRRFKNPILSLILNQSIKGLSVVMGLRNKRRFGILGVKSQYLGLRLNIQCLVYIMCLDNEFERGEGGGEVGLFMRMEDCRCVLEILSGQVIRLVKLIERMLCHLDYL